MAQIILHSDRLQFRLIDAEDLKVIHDLHSLPASGEFNTIGYPKDFEETKAIVEPWIAANQVEKIQRYTFALLSKSDSTFIGMFGFNLGNSKYKRAEVWYKILPDFWNQGYATESLKAIIKFGFEELDLHRIHAGCAVENIGSIKVLEKAGMLKEGRARKVLPLPSGWSDNFEYAILAEDKRDY